MLHKSVCLYCENVFLSGSVKNKNKQKYVRIAAGQTGNIVNTLYNNKMIVFRFNHFIVRLMKQNETWSGTEGSLLGDLGFVLIITHFLSEGWIDRSLTGREATPTSSSSTHSSLCFHPFYMALPWSSHQSPNPPHTPALSRGHHNTAQTTQALRWVPSIVCSKINCV